MKEANITFILLLGPDWIEDQEFPSVVFQTRYPEFSDQFKLDTRL